MSEVLKKVIRDKAWSEDMNLRRHVAILLADNPETAREMLDEEPEFALRLADLGITYNDAKIANKKEGGDA